MEETRTPEQIAIDAELELEMIPIRKKNNKAINHAFFFGAFLIGLLVVIKYVLLPLLFV